MSQQSKPTSFLVLLVVLAVALLLVSSLLTPNTTQSLQYSDVLDLFRNEKVASFTLEGSNLTMQVRGDGDTTSTVTAKIGDTEQFRADLDDLIAERYAAGTLKSYNYLPASDPWYRAAAPYIIGGIVLLIVFFFLSSRANGGPSGMANFTKANARFGIPASQTVTFQDVAGADEEKEELKRQVEELTAKLEERERQAGGIDDQVALMEKSYELAAKYMGQNGKDGAAVQNDNSPRQPAVAVQVARERTVSGLQQPLSDAEFMRRYSQPRNYGFNTAVGSGYTMGKNTIRACIHGDQTIMDGQTVKLRLLEPLQAGNLVIPQNTLVAGTGKVQGERLDIVVSSIEYRGNLLPVELAVYDSDGQKGLSVPSSLEQEAAKEAMANIGGGLGTSISFARSAGQQVAMDITRGLMQGGSQYLAKKFRTVKVHLKAGYELMLYAKQQ
mgnify:CR=1 FL=1